MLLFPLDYSFFPLYMVCVAGHTISTRRSKMKTGSAVSELFAVRKCVLMSAASLMVAVALGLSALIRIPVPGTPVPVTLQTFALLAGAGLLGRYYALQMVGWYIALGILGAPFFAGGSGYSYLLGASGGYLLGFFPAAFIAGVVAEKRGKTGLMILGYILSAAVLYIPGLMQLKLLTGASLAHTLSMGLYPFIATDTAKAILAAVGVAKTKDIFGR